MKRTIILLVLLLAMAALPAMAQQMTGKELIGTWRVTKVTAAPGQYSAAVKKKMAGLKNAFLEAIFQFKEGSHFSFEFGFAEMRIHDAFWMLSDNNSAVEIREWKDRSSSLMKIFITRNGPVSTFVMDETPFVLQVKKD